MNGNKIILLDNNEMLNFCLFMCNEYQKQANQNKDNRNESQQAIKQGGYK